MFDSIVEALFQELLHARPPDRDYHLSDLKGDLLPESVSRYAADVLRDAARSELDSNRPTALQWVEPDEETWALYDRFVAAAVSNAAAPAEEWAALLQRAVHRTVEHMFQPRTGLVKTVFPGDSDEELTHDEIAERIGGYHAGLSFRAAVVRALKKASTPQLDSAKFRTIVDRVHDAMTLDYVQADWRTDLAALRSILARIDLEEHIPTPAAAMLAEELGNADAAQTLRSTTSETVSLDEVIETISGPEPEESDQPDVDTEKVIESETGTTTVSTGPVPLWQRFQRNLNEPIAAAIEQTPSQPAVVSPEEPARTSAPKETPRHREEVSLESEESQRPLWQKYRSSRTPDSEEIVASDIEVFILGRDGARIRDSFVSELFRGDQDSYMDVLGLLGKARTWPEASRVIAENVFKRFQINIYSEEAVAFTNAVEARFRLQESGD